MTDTSRDASIQHDSAATDPRLTDALAALTLEEKVLLLTGHDFWTTWPIEKIGLRRMVVSDGPSGVRGEIWDERSPSLNLPSASALSSSWDTDIARRYGAAAAVEARRKGVDVVLGPTINLHRSPLGGRHFEAFSEDPILTADLAAAYVTGLQDNGVGATPKHYIANDSETDRFTVDVKVDERPLRELYLLAFEKAIVEARAWLVMSSYNSINGVTATENDLLETPLNSEWGFDGVVISDWTAVRSLASAEASQDLVFPGPDGPWGEALVAAVREGRIDESVVDRKVLRVLHLALRVGALGSDGPGALVHVEDGIAFAREAAAEGSVLLRNAGELPWTGSSLGSVAVIGNNAAFARTQGGGSATVLPEHTVSPLDGLRAALPDSDISYSLGAVVHDGLVGIPLDQMRHPENGEPGARIRFFDRSGAVIFDEHRLATELIWFGGSAPLRQAAEIELTLTLAPAETERVNLGFAATGRGRIWVDGELIVDEDVVPEGTDLGAAFLAPATVSSPVDLIAGEPREVRFLYTAVERDDALANALALSVGTQPADVDAERLIAKAVEAAKSADVALVVVGTNAKVESEGFDRTTLALPGRQDDLVRAVAAVNPRTVVVVNAGSPVLLPWSDDVAAVLVGYFGGQEFGHAIADVLLGVSEPGGRLPTTWPAADADVPVLDVTPADGELVYSEGIHIGYKAWLRQDAAPAFWFGHGLGYSQVSVTGFEAPDRLVEGGSVDVRVTVQNTGERRSKQVVQVYAERADSAIDRPARWLVGFASVRVDAGATETVTIPVPARLFANWADGWQYEAGEFTLSVGTSVVETPLSATLTLEVSA